MIKDAATGHSEWMAHAAAAAAPAPASTHADVSAAADPARLRQLVTQHFDFVWRSVRRLGVPDANAEDAAQEVFLVASRKLDHIIVDRERAFLFAVAMRVAMGHRRSRRRHPDHAQAEALSDVASASPQADELLDRARARDLLDSLIDELPLAVRATFVLFELEELTMQQIAELLELPIGTVASRLRRGREQFEAAIARHQARTARGGVR